MDSCIVSCCNVICSYFKTSLKKRFPLYITVAGDTWIRCTAFFIFVNKIVDYLSLIHISCGFGMGATPNAMANMQAVCDKYVPSVKAYLLIPLIGSLFADFLNSLVITFFINIL